MNNDDTEIDTNMVSQEHCFLPEIVDSNIEANSSKVSL